MEVEAAILSTSALSLIWLGIFIILLVIEILTVGLTTIWFAGGALAAMAASFFGVDLVWQIIIFLVVSFILLIFTRPWAVKHLNLRGSEQTMKVKLGKS